MCMITEEDHAELLRSDLGVLRTRVDAHTHHADVVLGVLELRIHLVGVFVARTRKRQLVLVVETQYCVVFTMSIQLLSYTLLP